jgi:hypothetical protein
MRDRRDIYRSHGKRRALERFGIVLNHEENRMIRGAITGAYPHPGVTATFCGKSFKSRRIYKINYHGNPMTIVWDKKRKVVVTVLPKEEPCESQASELGPLELSCSTKTV